MTWNAWLRWRTCTRKIARGHIDANRAVLAAWHRGDLTMHAYPCPYGQHWHVGHAIPDRSDS